MFLEGFTSSQVNFPDHFIPPSEKGKEWHMQFCMAAYGQTFNNAYMVDRYGQWRMNRLFAQGRQPFNRYVPQICGKDEDQTYININWRPISVIPKIRDSVINYISKINFRAEFNAINPEAVETKEQEKEFLWAAKNLEKDLADIESMTGAKLPSSPDTSWVPDNRDEFDAIAKTKVKLREEIRAELGCAQIYDDNEWKVLQRRLDEDGFDLAFEAIECRTNKHTSKIEVLYVDPVNLILPTMSGKIGDNIWIVGVVEPISLAQLYQEAGDQYTVEEYKAIAQYYQSRFNNDWQNDFIWDAYPSNNFAAWKSFTILRQRLYWYSTDVKKYSFSSKQPVDGSETQTTYRWQEFGKQNKPASEKIGDNGEIIKTGYGEMQSQTVHQASWIVGTQYLHDWGKLRDVSRDQMDKRQTMLPIKVYRIADQSRVERSIPYADGLCLSWYKLQDRMARSIPPGITINLDAIEKLIVDGKEMTTKGVVNMAIQTGVILHRVTDTMLPDNGAQPLPAIVPHEGNVNGIIETYIASMNEMKLQIRDTMGINDLMDTTMPNPKTLNGVAKLSYDNVTNSLYELVFARQYLFEKTSLDIVGKIQLKALTGDYQMYSRQLGVLMTIPQSLSLSQLGITVEAVPTDKDREKMKEMLALSLQQAQTPMDFDDMYYINNLIDTSPSLKYAEKLISLRIKQRREQIQKDKLEAIQAQGKTTMDAQQQNEQLLLARMQQENEIKKDYEQFMTDQINQRSTNDSNNRQIQQAQRSEQKIGEEQNKAIIKAATQPA